MKKTKGEKMRKIMPFSIISVFAVVTVFFLLFSGMVFGCSKASSNQTTATTAAETQASVEQTTAAKETVTETTEAPKPFEGKSLVISGSTTLLEVGNAWAEEFMKKFGGEITVNGGGSGVGIADMINKANDLANSSREIKEEEIKDAQAAGVEPEEHLVLYDGIAVIVSKNISVNELTIKQLSDIYTGKIRNWSEVGGPNVEIVTIARDSSSGTGEYFLERVVQLNKKEKENDYGDHCLRLQSNADIANQVSTNDNCIGYIGLGYLDSVEGKANIVAVKGEDKDSAVLPSIDTVKDKSYPISRGLYIYSNKNNFSEFAKAFIEFVLSDEGQAIGLEAGFVPVK